MAKEEAPTTLVERLLLMVQVYPMGVLAVGVAIMLPIMAFGACLEAWSEHDPNVRAIKACASACNGGTTLGHGRIARFSIDARGHASCECRP
jgi:hypothetical protein